MSCHDNQIKVKVDKDCTNSQEQGYTCFQDGNYHTLHSSQSSLTTKVIIHTCCHDNQGQGEYMSWQTRPFSAPVASGSKPASKTENITMNYLSSSENKLNFLTIHQPENVVCSLFLQHIIKCTAD